ncbi:glycosyltransferase family 39 protein [uncultured Arcticibacterium sp.]|uniref:glycosyltransferase family 39 protein n=1 Tax=uncultured Arcticibacterium sp. TaxID=2173042 RepID=UPI0030FC7C6C
MKSITSKDNYNLLYFLLAAVYLVGLFIPLMENDSAQHATMAMQIYLDNDFLHLFKGGIPYLDKPHMHFWLSAISFKIFGISHIAYRLPAILFTAIGAYSCYKLAKEFYGEHAAQIAPLIFLSTYAIILANHDVRTDAVLTGASIWSVWQLVRYIHTSQLKYLVVGAFAAAIAFSCKGHLSVFITGVVLLAYMAYARKWSAFFSWKSLLGLVVFGLGILPVVYAYYVQYDLHPELVIEGQRNVSGVKFILWDQNFNRLTAKGFGENNPDYLFFFHNLLWAFIPWSFIVYLAFFDRIKSLVKNRLKYEKGLEVLTSVGVIIVLFVISTSKFKLPHYLNSLLPILSVLVAGFLINLKDRNSLKTLKTILIVQYVSLTLIAGGVLYLTFWAFGVPSPILLGVLGLFTVVLVFIIKEKMELWRKIIFVSVSYVAIINFCLSTHYYPNIMPFQAGIQAAEVIEEEGIPTQDVFLLFGKYSWSLDFYTERNTPRIPLDEVKETVKPGQWLFFYGEDLEAVEGAEIKWNKKFHFKHFRVSKPRIDFLNPNNRTSVLESAYLVQVK